MGSEETPKTFGSQIRIEKYKPTYTEPLSYTEPLFSPNPYNPKLHKEIIFSSKVKSAKVYSIKGELVAQIDSIIKRLGIVK
jgi:hypothetical protein